MDPQTHCESYPLLLLQASIELAYGLDHAQSGPHGSLGIIFMRLRIAKVDQQAITEILRDVSVITRNHPGAGVLIGLYHLAQVFWVELAGKCCGVDQVTEQHGELAALGMRWRASGWWGRAGLSE